MNNNPPNPTPSAMWDKLRQIRWEYLADLPTPVADIMLDAANWIEAADQPPPNTDLCETCGREKDDPEVVICSSSFHLPPGAKTYWPTDLTDVERASDCAEEKLFLIWYRGHPLPLVAALDDEGDYLLRGSPYGDSYVMASEVDRALSIAAMPQQPIQADVERVHDDGTLKLLLRLADNDIEREGETASTMVRVGLLRDIINELLNYRAALLVSNRSGVEAAYREGHQTGRRGGSLLEEDDDWEKSKASAALDTEKEK